MYEACQFGKDAKVLLKRKLSSERNVWGVAKESSTLPGYRYVLGKLHRLLSKKSMHLLYEI